MGKGAALRWLEGRWISRYLRGTGVEIGALWRKFPVPARSTVWYVDRNHANGLQREYPEMAGQLVLPDIVADASDLPFADQSVDFVIASHVLEHLPFPLAALRSWHRVLRPGGVLLLKIPDKRYTFDVGRSRTPLKHLVEEDLHPETFDRRIHFEDWVEHVGKRPRGSDVLLQEVASLMEADYSIHYHVWTDEDMKELIDYTRTTMQLDWRPVLFLGAHFYRKECAVVLQRG